MITRPERYNATMERLYDLERQGRAFLVFPEDVDQLVSSTERDIRVLRRSLSYGTAQALRQWPMWEEFLRESAAAAGDSAGAGAAVTGA
jgi:predicted patatin/cPLA2 family phospholipase